MIRIVHVTDEALARVVVRYGRPVELRWEGEIDDDELALATYDPERRHDVTLFVLDPLGRLALIRKPPFAPGIWRPPGGGVKPGEDVVAGAEREAFEETGLRVRLDRYLVASRARFLHPRGPLDWRTHVFVARTDDRELAPRDQGEIAGARWGTPAELAGPLRERLLATGRAFWRYRVALHDAALAQLGAVSGP
jgi:8-oxo-dGTP pyrophosphatase MutT (NUDIX family)